MWSKSIKTFFAGVAESCGIGTLLMAKNPSGQVVPLKTNAAGSLEVTGAGGGGGDATAENQSTQITAANTANSLLEGLDVQFNEANGYLNTIKDATTTQATAANQSTQITAANTANTELAAINTKLTEVIEQVRWLNGGEGGMFVCKAETLYTGQTFIKLVINQACILTELVDSSSTNLLSLYNLTGVTLQPGMVINIPVPGRTIARVNLTGGSLIGYKD